MNSSPVVVVACVLFPAFVLVGLGCDFIAAEQNRLENKFRRLGMAESTLMLSDGARMQYWAGGEGPPVLLLHGFGAEAIWQWHHQVPALLAEHRVIVPNLLWFGRSTAEGEDFTLQRQVAAVVELLDSMSEQTVHAAGISYGGMVLYMLGAEHPERLGRVALLDSPGLAYSRADYAALVRRFDVPDIGRLLVPETTDDIQRLIDLAYHRPPTTPKFARRQVLQTLYAENRAERVRLLETAVDSMDELLSTTEELTVEALVIWGEHDEVFPLPLGEALAKRLGARLEVIGRAAHAPNLEHPGRVNELLVDFFRARPGI